MLMSQQKTSLWCSKFAVGVEGEDQPGTFLYIYHIDFLMDYVCVCARKSVVSSCLLI